MPRPYASRSLALFALAAAAGLGVGAAAGPGARAQVPASHFDGCDAGGGERDIRSLTAAYDAGTDAIEVAMELCAPPEDKSRYRLRLDHEPPTFLDEDRGDGKRGHQGDCAETADTSISLHKGRIRGPGDITIDEVTLRYRIATDDLDPALLLGDRVYLWADTEHHGIGDRAPTLESADGCARPEVIEEVVALDLLAPVKVVINEVVYDGEGADGDDTFTELHGPAGTDLAGWTLVGVNGDDGSAYRVVDLSGTVIPADGLLVVAGSGAAGAVLAARDVEGSVDWQNGPDAVVLVDAEGGIADALQYGDAGAHNSGEGVPAVDAASGNSLTRDGAHFDSDDNATDFAETTPSPGAP